MERYWGIMIVAAVVTYLIRALPFLVFSNGRTPEVILYLGRVLPYAIMGFLVVFALRNTEWADHTSSIPIVAATATVILLQRWKRNMLLSVVASTVLYMFLLQVVFV